MSSSTFLVVFSASGAPHSWENTMYLWELDLSRESCTCALSYFTAHVIVSKSGCMRSQEVPGIVLVRNATGAAAETVTILANGKWTSFFPLVYSCTMSMCIYAYTK